MDHAIYIQNNLRKDIKKTISNNSKKINICRDITLIMNRNGTIIEKYNYIKKKLKKNVDNPRLVIETIKLPSNKIINVVQDGKLLVGTKQRVAKLFIKKIIKKRPDIHTLLYAGTANGFGALAVAYAAYKLKLKSHVFLSNVTDYQSRQITTLHALNAKIIACPTFSNARRMEYAYSVPKIGTNQYSDLPGYYTTPMGLNTEEMIILLAKQIKKASKNTILETIKNPNIWLVAGSGGISMALRLAFPHAKIFIFLTGHGIHKKKVIEWSKRTKNVFIIRYEKLLNNSMHHSIYKKNNMNRLKNFKIRLKNNKENPIIMKSSQGIPYASVKNYDDLIFPYVKKYSKPGDFIWNIAADDYIF